MALKSPAINIGVTKEAVREARAAINDIVKSHAADSVKIAALDTLSDMCKVEQVTVSNCTFNIKE